MKILLIIILCFSFKTIANAEEIEQSTIKYNETTITSLSDDNYTTKYNFKAEDVIKISSETEINNLYIIYELKSSEGNIKINNENIEIGKNGFLHEYIDLTKNKTKELELSYKENVTISEIYLFDNGSIPSWVQIWKTQPSEVDLMLFSTHSDDEHLFFAGLIPNYLNQDKIIQVVYLTNHSSTPSRLHEQLNGLWAVGLDIYPVIGPFPDAYSTSLEGALSSIKNAGFTEENVIKFQVDNIRKYKPLVVVGHDENGEYSHGQHILNTYALKKAIPLINDKNYKTDYEPYNVSKVYLHLYENNKIIMNYDLPLKKYDNKTAYEVSKLGYKEHKSQQYTWFTDWLNGKNNSYTKATEITKYSPLEFGLYYSSVKEDIEKNDMFENISSRNNIKSLVKKYVLSKNIDHSEYYKYYIIIGILILLILTAGVTKKKKH